MVDVFSYQLWDFARCEYTFPSLKREAIGILSSCGEIIDGSGETVADELVDALGFYQPIETLSA